MELFNEIETPVNVVLYIKWMKFILKIKNIFQVSQEQFFIKS